MRDGGGERWWWWWWGSGYGERAWVRQMSAAVLNSGVITSTVAWLQTPHPRLTQRERGRARKTFLPKTKTDRTRPWKNPQPPALTCFSCTEHMVMLSHAKSTIYNLSPELSWSQNITSTGYMANRRDGGAPSGETRLTPDGSHKLWALLSFFFRKL